MDQIVFNDAQAESLIELLRDTIGSGDTTVITQQGASIVVGTSLTTATIDADGDTDLN